MYQEYVNLSIWNGAGASFGDIAYLRKGYQAELQKVLARTTSMSGFVNNSHIFCRLTGLLLSHYNPDVEAYLSEIYVQKNGIEKLFQFNSSVNGAVDPRPNRMYSKEGVSYFLSVSDVFDSTAPASSIAAVRSLSHPYTDTSFGMANGRYASVEKHDEVSVFAIDLLKFAYKVHQWFSEVPNKGEIKGVDYVAFVCKNILSDTITSHFDVAIFNRFCHMLKGDTTAEFFAVYPIAMVNYNKKLDDMLEQYVAYFGRNENISFERALSIVPAVFTSTIRNVHHLENMLINDNNVWVIFLSRLNLYLMTMWVIGNSRKSENGRFVNSLRRLIQLIEANQSVFSVLPQNTKTKIARLKFLVN